MERENSRQDVQRLIGEVAARHGILLKPDDAAFALVTINQLVLEEVMAKLLRNVEHAVAEFEDAAARVQTRAGSLLASEVKNAAAAIRGSLESDIATAGKQAREFVFEVHRAHSRAALEKWLALGITCALILLVIGVLVGRMLK
jgi:Transcriptional activator TraM